MNREQKTVGQLGRSAMGGNIRRTFSAFGMAAAVMACVATATPASAVSAGPFEAKLSGSVQMTSPFSAVYSSDGLATHLGRTHLEGSMNVTGPADCAGGFTATHSETMTAANGDQLFVEVLSTDCPNPEVPGRYDCTGTYAITGGTGRFSTASGQGGWAGTVTFDASGSGAFSESYWGLISL